MEKEEKTMTGEESLRIITDMVNKTKANIEQGSFHLLFWGWLIVACSLAEYFLMTFTDFRHPYYAWFLTIPGVVVSLAYGYIKGRSAKFHTYADKVYMWTWIGFLFTATTLFIIQAERMDSVAQYILLLMGLPTFISGTIIRFRPLIIGGACFWIFALFVNFTGPSIAPLGVPASMITGTLIPGYLLKKRAEHDKI